MENIFVQRLFFDPNLRYCTLQSSQQVQVPSEEFETNAGGTFSNLQVLVLTTLTDAVMDGGSIILAFLAVGAMGLLMFYMVNGIYVLSYILIQLLVGDGKSTSTDNKNLIYQLIFDQILLHRFWRRGSSSTTVTSPSRRPFVNRNINVRDNDRIILTKAFNRSRNN